MQKCTPPHVNATMFIKYKILLSLIVTVEFLICISTFTDNDDNNNNVQLLYFYFQAALFSFRQLHSDFFDRSAKSRLVICTHNLSKDRLKESEWGYALLSNVSLKRRKEAIWGRESLSVCNRNKERRLLMCDWDDWGCLSHKSKNKFGAERSNEIETGVFISATKVTKICSGNKKRSILEAFFLYVYS